MAHFKHRREGGVEAEQAVRAQRLAAQHAQQQADVAFMVRLRESSEGEVGTRF